MQDFRALRKTHTESGTDSDRLNTLHEHQVTFRWKEVSVKIEIWLNLPRERKQPFTVISETQTCEHILLHPGGRQIYPFQITAICGGKVDTTTQTPAV